jgi:hypothetical protein
MADLIWLLLYHQTTIMCDSSGVQVVGVASTFTGVWVEVAGLIAELDVLAGFADLATADPTRPYCKPEIVDRDEGDIVIKVGLLLPS